MENKEALKVLKSIKRSLGNEESFDWEREGIDVAISAIKKQIPMKPKINREGTTMWYACPVCGVYVHIGHYCHINACRQTIDWSE